MKLKKGSPPIPHPAMGPGESGQVIVETVLLLALVGIIAYSASEFFRSSQPLQKVIQAPWANLAGMIENGMWSPVDANSKNLHPNSYIRHWSLAGSKE
jgi:hypothetical protein